ncbi:MAG: metallopeptidase family protein [Elusimicrobia bacterium]|nr:metallopeptidase family protein [Elusimicrobiota bacterium]
MTIDEFERAVAVAVRALPAFFKERMVNVVITVRARPGAAQAGKFSGKLLGLYEGVPLPDRGRFYSGAMPDKITLFKDNIEAACLDGRDIKAEIRNVVMHETAHHFGITDAELRQKGLY